jgi:hypothetical protein
MKRAIIAAVAGVLAAFLAPAAAIAADVPVGVTASPLVSPTCPANAQGAACEIVLTQVTAYETLRDGVANPDMIKRSGVVVSFDLGLAGTSLITPAVLASLDKTYGGPPEVQLTVLRSVGTPTAPAFRVAAQSAVFMLRPELGTVADFPLIDPLPVVRGEMLAVTVPTWAPVLSFELSATQFAYAQSRSQVVKAGVSSCDTTGGANLAQLAVGSLSSYGCSYPGTRIEYSALEITTPPGFIGSARRHRVRSRLEHHQRRARRSVRRRRRVSRHKGV